MTKEKICAVHMKTIDHKAVGCAHITHVDCKKYRMWPLEAKLHENVPKNEWILTLNGRNKWQQKDFKGEFSHQALH